MLLDSGIVTIYELNNIAKPGEMPKEVLKPINSFYFGYRTIGYNRLYAAHGVNKQIDLLVRIWRADVTAGQYAVINGIQYRIDTVQQLTDNTGLAVTDLTLEKLGAFYDIVDN